MAEPPPPSYQASVAAPVAVATPIPVAAPVAVAVAAPVEDAAAKEAAEKKKKAKRARKKYEKAKQKKQMAIMAGFCCLCCTIGWFASGAALAGVSNTIKEQIDALDPEEDFEYLGIVCKISDVRHEENSYNQRCENTYSNSYNSYNSNSYSNSYSNSNSNSCTEHIACDDTYKYKYSYEGTTFSSISGDQFSRCDNDQCDDCQKPRVPSTYETGEEIECWKPTGGRTASEMSSYYGCIEIEPDCVVATDPKDTIEAARGGQVAAGIGGVVFFVFGGLALCLLVPIAIFYKSIKGGSVAPE